MKTRCSRVCKKIRWAMRGITSRGVCYYSAGSMENDVRLFYLLICAFSSICLTREVAHICCFNSIWTETTCIYALVYIHLSAQQLSCALGIFFHRYHNGEIDISPRSLLLRLRGIPVTRNGYALPLGSVLIMSTSLSYSPLEPLPPLPESLSLCTNSEVPCTCCDYLVTTAPARLCR